MSLVGAPLPPEPLPWENVDYEDNLSGDEESDVDDEYSMTSETDLDYESDDTSSSFKIVKKKRNEHTPVPYYKNILQEEEYFSE